MEFDNQRVIFSTMRIELIATIIFGATFSLAFLDIYKTDFLPLKSYQFALIIVFIFFLVGYVWYGFPHSFFHMETNNSDIIIRYFKITPKFIKAKPKMIVVPKNTYVKYLIEYENYFLWKRKNLILFQKTPKGIVKYPPIHISSLNEDELQKLKSALQY